VVSACELPPCDDVTGPGWSGAPTSSSFPDCDGHFVGSLASLRIQTVLFEPRDGDIQRLVRGLGNAVRVAKRHDQLGPVSFAIGDCSGDPSLTPEVFGALERSAHDDGVDHLSFEHFGSNLGSAGGHNRLLENSDETAVLTFNPDAYPSPDLLLQLAVPLVDKEVGIVEAKQIPLEHPKDFDRTSGETSWASTAAALIRRSVIEAIGGFDADAFFLYCDDVDFSWRARLAGFRVTHQPSARIFHDKRLTTEGTMVVSDAEIYYAAEAAMMLAWKYSHPELAMRLMRGFSSSPLALHRRVASRFRARMDEETLPHRLDPDGHVAEFHPDGNYARHRFSYND